MYTICALVDSTSGNVDMYMNKFVMSIAGAAVVDRYTVY